MGKSNPRDINSRLTASDFEKMFDEEISADVRNSIDNYGFVYRDVTAEERDGCIKKIVGALIDPGLARAGQDRYSQWETGWSENLAELATSLDTESILPRYFGKYDFLRLNRKFIKPISPNFEYCSLRIILDWLFDKHMKDVGTIYEFGCGTGHHLIHARQFNPTAKLWGLDWTTSSQEIIRRVAINKCDPKLFANRFDYYNPDMNFILDKDSVVYTVASLEQVGNRYDKFVDYLQKNKPRLCIHIEPIAELLDECNLLDYLSIEYFKKRNYLNGFLDYLRMLESGKKIKIVTAKRTFVGSLFIEGYSVIVWSPFE